LHEPTFIAVGAGTYTLSGGFGNPNSLIDGIAARRGKARQS
jgi:hypothetical protein